MKITAQEEYGLRIMIRIASCKDQDGMSIPQLSEAEGISPHYVAKLTRSLRMAGFINSTPGYKGGYVLAMPAQEIVINHVLKALGGALFDSSFCGTHAGTVKLCTHSVDCSSRSLWQMVQLMIDQFLDQVTLHDLVNKEKDSNRIFAQMVEQFNRTLIRQE
ncbi:RrF2 family transcriptional regulator [Flavisolibacter tropicus]|uniref:Rrf2 family transcriptional regulator n=1 Tax=Flavisolibacter tropicus TaxID=1492898 RepID=A0A172TS67_9BACT|nr:Rrf2 family transcriptional regulator [Flavisolibacter tropicus]ANE49929.1 Rrf2 family transcriptional regulator [Flavisolibacter tropicus]